MIISQRHERCDSGSQNVSQLLQFGYKQILGTFKSLPWSIMKAFSFDTGEVSECSSRVNYNDHSTQSEHNSTAFCFFLWLHVIFITGVSCMDRENLLLH